MRNLNLIAEELFNKIRGRFPSVTIGDSNGKVTNKPDLARFYDFDYTEGDAKLGRVSVTIDEESVEVMYSNDFVANEDTITRNNWYSFLKELRAFSKKRLLKFDTRNINKSNLDQRDYKFLATNRTGDGTMTESKMYGTSKTSYQNVGEARIAIKHNKPVNTESASGRIQNISAIYIESADGERFKYPFKHVNGARAMARHVSEGGKPFDEFGTHVASLSEELVNLKRFKSYVNRSSVMAEGLSGYKLAVNERVEELKKTITSLQKENFYKTTFENFVKPIFEDIPEDVAENWIDQLTIRQFNEELKDVFPFVYRLVSEATKATVVTASDLLGESDIDDELSEEQPAESYVVKSGDTIWSIADRFSNSNYMGDTKAGAKDILELNGITDPRSLQPGQKLEIGYVMGTGPDGGTRGLPPGGFKSYEAQIEDSFEDMMGQFAEAKEETKVCKDCGDTFNKPTTDCKHDSHDPKGSHWVDANNNGIGDLDESEDDDDTMDVKIDKNGNLSKDNGQDGKEQKIPVSEFILSMFDRESGQFPKGETAVLTAIEKDYGEQYINPGKAFIEAINAKFEELNGSQDPMIDEDGILSERPFTSWEEAMKFAGDFKQGTEVDIAGRKHELTTMRGGEGPIWLPVSPTGRDIQVAHERLAAMKKAANGGGVLDKIKKFAGLGEEPQGTVMEPTVEQDDDLSEDLSQNYENDAEAIKALTAASGHSPEEHSYLKMLAYKYDFYGKPENIGTAIAKAEKAAADDEAAYMASNRGNVGDPGETPSTPDAPANFPSIEAAMQKVMYYEPGEKANIGGQLHVRDVKDGKKIWRPVKAAPAKAAPAKAAPANPDATDPRGRDQRGESQEQVDIKRLAGL